MKLKEYRETYYFYSGKASDISRQLGFAGIALIWAFKVNGQDGAISIGSELFLAGVLLVAALFLDLLHYVAGTVIWGTYSRHKERQGTKPDTTLHAPRYFNWPALVLFGAKIGLMLAAYVVLACYLWNRVS